MLRASIFGIYDKSKGVLIRRERQEMYLASFRGLRSNLGSIRGTEEYKMKIPGELE